MQQAQQIIDTSVRSIKSGKPTLENQTSEKKLYRVRGELLTLAELFWSRMTGLYGYPWTKQHGVDPTPEWELCLSDATPESIGVGIDRMSKDKAFAVFPPNPMQFRAMCLPRGEDLGLPSFEAAFSQAVGINTNKHPSVIYALNQMGDNFGFKQLKTDPAKAVFQEAWNKTLSHVMAGGKFPKKKKEIKEDAVLASKEFNLSQMASLKELMA